MYTLSIWFGLVDTMLPRLADFNFLWRVGHHEWQQHGQTITRQSPSEAITYQRKSTFIQNCLNSSANSSVILLFATWTNTEVCALEVEVRISDKTKSSRLLLTFKGCCDPAASHLSPVCDVLWTSIMASWPFNNSSVERQGAPLLHHTRCSRIKAGA